MCLWKFLTIEEKENMSGKKSNEGGGIWDDTPQETVEHYLASFLSISIHLNAII